MPLKNWIQCTEGDLTGCRINGLGNATMDELMWDVVHDDYIKEMGLDKTYKRLLEVMKKKAEIECDYVSTNDRFNLTLLEIEEQNLKDLVDTSGGKTSGGVEKSLVYISKWVGSWLNPKNMTTKEYFILLKEMEKINKNNT
jgi:hypothetical protein